MKIKMDCELIFSIDLNIYPASHLLGILWVVDGAGKWEEVKRWCGAEGLREDGRAPCG